MKVNKRQFSDNQICIFMYVITFLMMVVLGAPLSISYILDETGTVANAAFLAGYNWNDWVNATGGYFYKYGQAIFYYPIFKFATNPYIIYKLLMFINGIFVAFIPVFAYKILRIHLNEENKLKCMLSSLCIAVIPATVLYSLYARADVMLISFSWVAIYSLLECMDAEDKKSSIILSALTAFLSVYMYMCHSRGIVFVIAIFMIMFILRYLVKNKSICFSSYLVSLIFWLLIDNKLTKYFKNSIWGSGIKKNTLSNVKYEKYKNLLTAEGIETLVKNASGWLFNSFLGTFGLVLLGLFFAAIVVICYVTKKKDISVKELAISMYAFLIYLGTLAMSMLFSFGSNYKFVTGVLVKRADRFLYSRYVSSSYGILIFVAIFYLFFKTECFGLKTKIAALLFGAFLIVYCRTWLGGFVNNVEYSWRNTIDSAIFFDTVRYGNDANEYEHVSRSLLFAAVLAFAVLSILIVLNYFRIKNNFVFVFIGMFFLASLSVNYAKLRFSTDVRPLSVVGTAINKVYDIEKETDISETFPDVYIDKSVTRYKMMQLALPMFDVHMVRSIQPEEVDNMLVISRANKVNKGWAGDDCYFFEDFVFEEDNAVVLVKGEELKNELESKGIKLTELPEGYTDKRGKKELISFAEAVERSFDYQFQTIK